MLRLLLQLSLSKPLPGSRGSEWFVAQVVYKDILSIKRCLWRVSSTSTKSNKSIQKRNEILANLKQLEKPVDKWFCVLFHEL